MTTISAKVIRRSVNPAGNIISTVQLRYPRFIHAELMTHRMFSRNAQSNRAIPIERVVEDVMHDTAMPIHWGSNKAGMQAGEEIQETYWAEQTWLNARDAAVEMALDLHSQGLHKQVANRLLEPFQHINVLVTATEWDNFFNLRDHPDAEPHIQLLAKRIKKAFEENAPQPVYTLDWHIPYVPDDWKAIGLTWNEVLMVSAARCARVSYLTHDQRETTIEEDLKLATRLLESKHMSPFEHVAQAIYGDGFYANFKGWKSYRFTLESD